MTIESTTAETDTAKSPLGRWNQLVVGVLCMVMIANLQYGWTLFVNPIDQKYHWGTAAIQVAFSVFIATETWLVPIEGWFVDRFGPRVVVALGGVFVAGAWALNSVASSLWELYIAAALVRHRCRRGLWHLRRQCAQMVSRSARPRRRPDRGGVRRRHRRDRHPHPRNDPRLWL